MSYQTTFVLGVFLFAVSIASVFIVFSRPVRPAIRNVVCLVSVAALVGGAFLFAAGSRDVYPSSTEERREVTTNEYPIADISSVEAVISGGRSKSVDATFSYIDGDRVVSVVVPVNKLDIRVADTDDEERVSVTTESVIITTKYDSGRVNDQVIQKTIEYTVWVHVDEETR